MELDELQKMFTKEFGLLKKSLEDQANEIKEFGETKKGTADAITKASERMEAIKVETDAKNVEIAELFEEQKTSLEEQKGRIDEMEKASQRPGYGTGEEIKSPGQMYTESDAYKNMITNNLYNSAPMKVKSLFEFEEKALVTSVITGGNLAQTLRYPEIIMTPMKVLRIRDLLSVRGITTNAIEYVQETGFVNKAAPTKVGAKKPESALTFKLLTESVKTIAHWIPASRQVLADVAQIRAYIDTRLIYGLKLTEEAKILYVIGVSQNLPVIIVNTGIQS